MISENQEQNNENNNTLNGAVENPIPESLIPYMQAMFTSSLAIGRPKVYTADDTLVGFRFTFMIGEQHYVSSIGSPEQSIWQELVSNWSTNGKEKAVESVLEILNSTDGAKKLEVLAYSYLTNVSIMGDNLIPKQKILAILKEANWKNKINDISTALKALLGYYLDSDINTFKTLSYPTVNNKEYIPLSNYILNLYNRSSVKFQLHIEKLKDILNNQAIPQIFKEYYMKNKIQEIIEEDIKNDQKTLEVIENIADPRLFLCSNSAVTDANTELTTLQLPLLLIAYRFNPEYFDIVINSLNLPRLIAYKNLVTSLTPITLSSSIRAFEDLLKNCEYDKIALPEKSITYTEFVISNLNDLTSAQSILYLLRVVSDYISDPNGKLFKLLGLSEAIKFLKIHVSECETENYVSDQMKELDISDIQGALLGNISQQQPAMDIEA